jgi:Icc-related predicted phosphoesterase
MTEFTPPVRILAIADIHGVMSVYEWLVVLVEEYQVDLLLIAGDLFAADWEDGQREQARQIIPVLKRVAAPCFYIMGNDDNVALDFEDEQIKPLHGRRHSYETYNLVGYQYTPPFVGKVFVKSEEEIDEDLQSLEPLIEKPTILVTHAPAFGVLDRSFGGEHVGSRALGALFHRRPVLVHIHGHIHGDFGRDENHFNVAAAGRRRAAVIDLPSLDHQVLRAE